MSEMKHTPGPWEVGASAVRGTLCVQSADSWICGELRALNAMAIPLEEARANAHLISAAPDMFEALTKALPFIDDALDAVTVMSDSVLTKECREVVRLARAALSKATPTASQPSECWSGCTDPQCPYTHPER